MSIPYQVDVEMAAELIYDIIHMPFEQSAHDLIPALKLVDKAWSAVEFVEPAEPKLDKAADCLKRVNGIIDGIVFTHEIEAELSYWAKVGVNTALQTIKSSM